MEYFPKARGPFTVDPGEALRDVSSHDARLQYQMPSKKHLRWQITCLLLLIVLQSMSRILPMNSTMFPTDKSPCIVSHSVSSTPTVSATSCTISKARSGDTFSATIGSPLGSITSPMSPPLTWTVSTSRTVLPSSLGWSWICFRLAACRSDSLAHSCN